MSLSLSLSGLSSNYSIIVPSPPDPIATTIACPRQRKERTQTRLRSFHALSCMLKQTVDSLIFRIVIRRKRGDRTRPEIIHGDMISQGDCLQSKFFSSQFCLCFQFRIANQQHPSFDTSINSEKKNFQNLRKEKKFKSVALCLP